MELGNHVSKLTVTIDKYEKGTIKERVMIEDFVIWLTDYFNAKLIKK